MFILVDWVTVGANASITHLHTPTPRQEFRLREISPLVHKILFQDWMQIQLYFSNLQDGCNWRFMVNLITKISKKTVPQKANMLQVRSCKWCLRLTYLAVQYCRGRQIHSNDVIKSLFSDVQILLSSSVLCVIVFKVTSNCKTNHLKCLNSFHYFTCQSPTYASTHG